MLRAGPEAKLQQCPKAPESLVTYFCFRGQPRQWLCGLAEGSKADPADRTAGSILRD